MNDQDELEVIRSTEQIKDVHKRRLLMGLGLTFVLLLAGTIAATLATFMTLMSLAEDGTTLAQQIEAQCNAPGSTDPDLAQFCPKASEIVETAPNEIKQTPVPAPAGPVLISTTPSAEPTSCEHMDQDVVNILQNGSNP